MTRFLACLLFCVLAYRLTYVPTAAELLRDERWVS